MDVTKVTVLLPTSELEALEKLAKQRGKTCTETLRQAIATELYLQGLVDDDAKILVSRKSRIDELLFSQMETK